MSKLSITDSDIRDISKVFKVISNPRALKILRILGRRELNIQDILKDLDILESVAYRHLAVLRDKHIVTAHRYNGGKTFYSVKDYRILKLFNMLKEPKCQS